MGDKAKELCKWKRDEYEDDLASLRQIVANPKHVCTKCGRAAEKKKHLCRPRPLKDT